MNQEPLPQIHLIRDTDLSVFAYELHIFAGDFLRECEFNMRSLATNTGADSIAIMGKNHMWLSDALFAYCSTADLHQMILTTEFIGARAFLFHTDRSEGGHLYGDVLMMDLDTLRQDIKRNILYPCGVNIERKDGSAATVSLKEWTEMVDHLEEQERPATIIKTLLKHAKIQVDQAAKAFEHASRQQVLGESR